MRTSGVFDGVFDFDQVLQDPSDPKQLLPKYDSGDHLQPSDAGYRGMAQTVELDALGASRYGLDFDRRRLDGRPH